MGETALHQESARAFDYVRQTVVGIYERMSRKAVAITAVGAFALSGCATAPGEINPADTTPTPVSSTLDPTTPPASETPTPTATESSPSSSATPSEQAPQSSYEVPPKYAKAKKMSEKKFIGQDPETKSQFLQGITHDLVEGSKVSNAKLREQIVETLEAGYAPWMATSVDDPQMLMIRLSMLQKTAKLLYQNGDRTNARKVISMLDVRPKGVYEYAQDPFWGIGTREEWMRDNVADPTIIINSYHPDWGGQKPLAYDYEWITSRGGDAKCAEYDPINNPDGALYVFAAARDQQKNSDEKRNGVLTMAVYAPEAGVSEAYYNPSGQIAPESGKFSLVQFFHVSQRKDGLDGFMDWDMMQNITPPMVEDSQQATLSYNPNIVICDWSRSKWLGGLERIE